MIGTCFPDEGIFRDRLELFLDIFLQKGFIVFMVPVLKYELNLRVYDSKHELFGRTITRIEIKRANDSLNGIGQYRFLCPAARHFLTLAKDKVFTYMKIKGNTGKGFLGYNNRFSLGQVAF